MLLMELLYARPEILPDEIAIRAGVAMTRVSGSKTPLQEVILSIMEGSGGQVVETMFSLCGGSSGAALPATMVSIILWRGLTRFCLIMWSLVDCISFCAVCAVRDQRHRSCAKFWWTSAAYLRKNRRHAR